MSCMEQKIVLRTELPQLKGKSKTEVFPIIKQLLGEPDELDEFNGEIDYFRYDGEFQPVYDYNHQRWGVDWVLHHESDYRTYIEMKMNGVTLDNFEQMATIMAERFGIDKSNVKLLSYSWYNGADEPIEF